MAVPNTFASATSAIPLANLDANFTYYDTAYSITGTTVAFAGNITVTGTSTLTGVATLTANPVLSAGTANGVTYLNGSKSLTSGTGLVFDGTNLNIGTATSVTNRLLNIQGSAVAKPVLVQTTTTNSFIEFNDSGTTNKPAMGSVGDALAFLPAGTERMRIDSSGNVGIGTSNNNVFDQSGGARPLLVQKSDTSTTIAGSLAAITISNGDTTTNNTAQLNFAAITGASTNQYSSAVISAVFGARTNGQYPTGQLVFSTSTTLNVAPTEKMRIDSSGNVGIGTSSPTEKLHLSGAESDTGLGVKMANTGTGGRSYSILSTANGSAVAGALDFRDDTASASRMLIDSSGNVGIGTSSPVTALSISGALSFTAVAAIPAVGSSFFAPTANTLAFGTASTERMRIDSSGNFLVGTTSGSTKMYVVDSSTSVSTVRIFKNVASSQAVGALTIDKFDNTSTTAQIFVQFTINNQGTGSGQINANGASAAAFGSFSDSRLKENITELPSQLANIMALRPVEFDYIESEGGGHQIGFIAQEVKEIYPDLVGERADGMFTLTDMNKNDARLIKAIQEQQALITTLTARITALEAK